MDAYTAVTSLNDASWAALHGSVSLLCAVFNFAVAAFVLGLCWRLVSGIVSGLSAWGSKAASGIAKAFPRHSK